MLLWCEHVHKVLQVIDTMSHTPQNISQIGSKDDGLTVGLLQPRGTFSWGRAPIFRQKAVNFTSTLTASLEP